MATRNNTIFALATPYGKSSVAIIRISGEEARMSLKHLGVEKPLEPRTALLSKLYSKESGLIDQALILWFPKPHSFTGEDVVEIQPHGSKAVVDSILSELSKHFTPAGRGEFSKRAFLNGKMDLTQAEGLADLIEAETAVQLTHALRHVGGDLSTLCKQWYQQLLDITARVEATIDFPEDVDSGNIEISNAVATLINSLETHVAKSLKASKIFEGFYVAIIGPPNSGKSTLLNHLTYRDLAMVSKTPGTTRDVIEAHLDLGGHSVILADTAGVRETQDDLESQGIQRAKQRAENADIKVVIISLQSYLQEGLEPGISQLVDDKAIKVLSKSDEVAGDPKTPEGFIVISTHKETGIDALKQAIIHTIENEISVKDPPLITKERHVRSIKESVSLLRSISDTKPLELCAEDLKNASDAIKSIVGEITNDKILETIFSKFCIGK